MVPGAQRMHILPQVRHAGGEQDLELWCQALLSGAAGHTGG